MNLMSDGCWELGSVLIFNFNYLLVTSRSLFGRYSKWTRPARNISDVVIVKFGLSIAQLIDVEWTDYKLQWNPSDFDNVTSIRVPSELIWVPDIVLYNNADGEFAVTHMTKAHLFHTGLVRWVPPAIYKSSCSIDVTFFPFDQQSCKMKFGSWTYDRAKIDLEPFENTVDLKKYDCCHEIYPDITLLPAVRLRREDHAVHLRAAVAHRLPAAHHRDHPLHLAVIPLIGEYLLFTMIFVTLSIVITCSCSTCTTAPRPRTPCPRWVKRLFLSVVPRWLCMKRPPRPARRRHLMTGPAHCLSTLESDIDIHGYQNVGSGCHGGQQLHSLDTGEEIHFCDLHADNLQISPPSLQTPLPQGDWDTPPVGDGSTPAASLLTPALVSALGGVTYIAEHLRAEDADFSVKEEWKYVAMVVDRIFLWMFIMVCLLGTVGLFLPPWLSGMF
ncbi:hypothetical protein F7725_009322 [Dissostichus mawsoni]|uniref:Uncharacterized protein n=1 Tax=Dissostichus mawsoni TaxID=36200 RepID=A0A7J5Z7G9_DISMA|nr:hypothetical protein F7725_009322 [Dissostichus mawsoni]